jgi:subtilisin family serine protease
VILRGHIPPGQLQVLANSSDVLWIEPGPNIRLYDEVSSKIVAGDGGPGQTLAQEFGYDGHGVTVAVADTGLDTGEVDDMHPDLAGRVTGLFYYGNLTGASDEHGHGTHVAGIIGGNGATGETDEAGALYGLGVASGVNIVAQRIFDADGNYEAPPSNETLTRDAVRAGAEIGSNSWGDDTQGRYDLSAMEFDGLVRDADELAAGDQPYILEFSAGNAGPGGQTIGSPAVAKNVIASGASQNDRVDLVLYEDGPDAMADFSSRGPCEDGRIKPDVVAPGTWIASLRSRYANDEFAWAPISDHYMYEGGTSQSGPHVSGAAAVFVQYYREVNTNRTPSPALVKAALINSAVDMDNSVETDPVPNLDEGWGRVDLTGLLFATRPGQFLDQAVLLQTGQTYERRVIIASAEEPLKITLAYTDVPGFPAAIPALVNDLDLEVIAPDGTVFHGNQFEDGESIPNAPGFDAINNVEGVHLSAPLPGEYVVRVRARNVVQDARRDTGAVDQDFAMVISGDIPLPGLGFVFLDRRAYTSPSTIRVKVIDSDLAGLRTVSVMLKSGTQPAGLELALLAADTTGSFTGALATATSPQGGRLQIVHGDTITAEYYDDSLGTMRSATARADLLPPNISAVGTTAQFGHTVVLWQTDEPAYGQVYFGTNRVLNRTASHATLLRDHAVRLEDLTPGVAYQFFVVSEDEAGNRATNNNGGSYFTFVPVGAAMLLLVDAFNNDDFAFGPDIPLSTYTDALDQVGIGYEVWDATALTGSDPTLSDLKPYRVVIWRVSDNVFLGDTLSPAVQTALQQYVDGGGSFFMASMEQLSRLTATFKQNVLQVAAFTEDDTAPSAVGFVGNPVSGGMNIGLDYSYYQTDNYELFQVPDDVSDTMTVTTNAMPILHDGFGGIVGLASPRTGLDRPGRVVFLSFPLDAVPESDAAPNNRATLMRNILTFLAPGDQGVGTIALGSPAYTLPSLVTMEVADSDLAGQGQISASISSTTEPAGRTVTLAETARRGVFRGQITLVAVHGANPAAELLAKGGDQVIAAYLDASAGRTITATSIVEVIPPAISGVTSEPSYVDATIHWTTDEPADALVQFGESPLLGRTAYLSTLETSHEVFLDGLRPDRLYYYQISSRDQAGNVQVADHGGAFYTFRTLLPLSPPWSDDLEHGSDNWTVINADESEGGWTYGQPENELANTGHSGRFAWGSNLNGEPIGYVESFLISPPIDLTGGNTATLRFWQNYDFSELEFDILHYGEVMLITNAAVAPVTLGVVSDLSGDWEQAEFDLSPHLGKLVYVVWHYVLFSFDNAPRGGWLVDDVSVTTSQITPGTIRITNNIWQARWSLTGPANRSGQGTSALLTNLAPGDYTVEFNDVPYYSTPSMLSGTLAQGGSLVFAGNYGFADVNNNGMADAWEQQNFGVVSPSRTRFTDTDGDGMTDAAEFAAGTVPTQSSSNLRLALPVPLNGGAVRLEWPAVPGRAYLLEGSSDGKTWVPVSPWMQAGSTLGFFSPPTGPGAPYLFRLQVKP